MIFLYILALVAGFAALIKGADFFVDGSASLARIFRVPAMIVGLTIVAMGTSAPELAVSTLAAIEGSNEIALSNVVGSNVFNILFILGTSATIMPLHIEGINIVDYLVMVLAAVLTGVVVFTFGKRRFDRVEGVIFLAIYVAYTVYLLMRS